MEHDQRFRAAGRDTRAASALFAQALHENSNLELEWLWFWTQLTDEGERRYCVERALAINPHSALARWALAQRRPSTTGRAAAARIPAWQQQP